MIGIGASSSLKMLEAIALRCAIQAPIPNEKDWKVVGKHSA